MYSGISAAFLPALRTPHTARGYVEAFYGGAPVLWNGSARLPLLDGEVSVDGGTPGVRRTLSVSLAGDDALWDALVPFGTELRAYTELRYPNGEVETVPQGVFDVDTQARGYARDGQLRITAPDRWVRIQRGRFLTPRSSTPGQTFQQQIASLLLEVLPAGTTVTDTSTVSTGTVPTQTWDKDRDKAVQDLAAAAGLDVYFDRNGTPVIRDAPTISADQVWDVDASETGVAVTMDRQRDRQRTFNIVVVNGESTDGTPTFATQYVWDADPNSPTYAGPGTGSGGSPPSGVFAGPFGQRPTFYPPSPLLLDSNMAIHAGLTMLRKVTGLNAQVELTAISNPALDDGDTIGVLYPPGGWGEPARFELHLIDSLSVPLTPHKTAQKITTRSTVADLPETP